MAKTALNKWTDLMNAMKWEGIAVWQDINALRLEETIPKVEQWVIDNLPFLECHPQEKAAFRNFYWGKSSGTSYSYLRKDRAECAMAALYTKERLNGGS